MLPMAYTGLQDLLPAMPVAQDSRLTQVKEFAPSNANGIPGSRRSSFALQGITSPIGNSLQGSRRNSQSDVVKHYIQEEIAKCRQAQTLSLDELTSQIHARMQAHHSKLEAEVSKLRKENEWLQSMPSSQTRRHSSMIGLSRRTAEPGNFPIHPKSATLQPSGTLEVLDVDASDGAAAKDDVKRLSAHSVPHVQQPDGDELGQPPAPLSNNLLTAVVPLPKDEAPKTAVDETPSEENVVSRLISSPVDPTTFSEVSSCDDDERHNFKVLPIWLERKIFKSHRTMSRMDKTLTQELRQSVADFGEMEGAAEVHNPFADFNTMYSSENGHNSSMVPRTLVIHPNGVCNGIWDLTSLILVSYDLVFIPLMLMDLPDSTFSNMIAWTCRIFWTIDLCLSPITGYVDSTGSIEMRPRKIFMRYLKTWLFVDLLIVTVDWLEIIWVAGSGLGFARIGKASRVFRILRLVRLLRLIRMADIMREILDRIHSERLVILLSIFKIMIVICGMAHLMACVWYGIGNGDNKRGTWVDEHLLYSDSLQYRYMTSLHWAVSQFSGGMDEVRPQNFLERTYAILCFLIAFMMAGVFISSITSSMTQLYFLSSRRSQQITVLRRFLAQHGISHRLAVRVQRNATHAVDQQQRYMPEANVELLALVSTPLRSRVHFEMYAPTFSVHPFFAKYVESCPHVMRRVCHSATSMALTSCCDVIFNAGEIAAQPAMYIVCSGFLNYVSLTGKKYLLSEDAVLAEAVLWTTWMHQGTLTAETNSHLLVLDAHGFQYIVTQFEHIDFDPKEYADKFVKDLNEGERELSDLPKHIQDDDEQAIDMQEMFSQANKNKRKGDRIFGMRRAKSDLASKGLEPVLD